MNRPVVRAWQAVLPVADLPRVVQGIISGAAKLGRSSVQYINGSDSRAMEMRCVFRDLAASHRSAEYDPILRTGRVPGSRFMMAEVLPLADDDGGDAPSYQVYLALSWLRSGGAISGNGRGGYLADVARISDSNLEALWEALPEQA